MGYSVEGKVKVVREIENKKKGWRLWVIRSCKFYDPHYFEKQEPTLLVHLNRTDPEYGDFRKFERTDVGEALLKWFNLLAPEFYI